MDEYELFKEELEHFIFNHMLNSGLDVVGVLECMGEVQMKIDIETSEEA